MNDKQYDKYIGRVLDGQYRIEKIVGKGGMAIVFKATDLKNRELVAVKMLLEKHRDEPTTIRRFSNESRCISKVNSEYVVKIKDVKASEESNYIVMEYIQGVTLREYMDYVKIVEWRDVVNYSIQILKALQCSHEQNIIHRDIKPQNIMLLPGGKVKVTDFGIAKSLKSETLTMVDKTIGTVFYISPEQVQGHKIDSRSDLYSLGIVMYEMACGRLPFVSEEQLAVLVAHTKDIPTPPTTYNPNIPHGLEQIILCLLEKDPDNRYSSATQVIKHLERLKENPTIIFESTKNSRSRTEEAIIKETRLHQDLYSTTGQISRDQIIKNSEMYDEAIKERRIGVPSQKRNIKRPPMKVVEGALDNDSHGLLWKEKKKRKTRKRGLSFFLAILICALFGGAAFVLLGILIGKLLIPSVDASTVMNVIDNMKNILI